MSSENVERLAALFAGSSRGHGTHAEPIQQPGSLKWEIKSTARTIREPPTLERWRQHLSGERPLGVIPIREDGACKWGSIDVDQYDGNLLDIVSRIERANLPLVPCRSKSGGLHLYAFFKDWLPATLVLPALKHIAAGLGLAKDVEIFPKQTQLVSKDDLGNWILSPYFGGDYGGKLKPQVGLKKTGAEMELSEFLRAAEGSLISAEQLTALGTARVRATTNAVTSTAPLADGFADGPPCLQHLVTAGLLGDGRKRALFHMGVYYKRAQPDGWRKALEQANQDYMTPPLPSEEVAGVVRSLGRKDYNYKCKEEPMVSHCDAISCRSRRFGVGEGSAIPAISGLTKLDTSPTIWFVDVEDRRIECNTEQLQNYRLFHALCMERLHRTYASVKQSDWFMLLGGAMSAIQLIDAPAEVGVVGHFTELLEEYLTNRAQAEKFEDLPSGRPWFDEEGSKRQVPCYFFRLREFQDFLKRVDAPREMLPRTWITQRIRDMGGSDDFFNIKGKGCKVWRVPAAVIDAAPRLELPQPMTVPV